MSREETPARRAAARIIKLVAERVINANAAKGRNFVLEVKDLAFIIDEEAGTFAVPTGEEEYLTAQGAVCPFCRKSTDLNGQELVVSDGTASQLICCGNCGSSHSACYDLAGYVEGVILDKPVAPQGTGRNKGPHFSGHT